MDMFTCSPHEVAIKATGLNIMLTDFMFIGRHPLRQTSLIQTAGNARCPIIHRGVAKAAVGTCTILVECYALLASGSAHAKLEAHITLQYVQCLSQIYMIEHRTFAICMIGNLTFYIYVYINI